MKSANPQQPRALLFAAFFFLRRIHLILADDEPRDALLFESSGLVSLCAPINLLAYNGKIQMTTMTNEGLFQLSVLRCQIFCIRSKKRTNFCQSGEKFMCLLCSAAFKTHATTHRECAPLPKELICDVTSFAVESILRYLRCWKTSIYKHSLRLC